MRSRLRQVVSSTDEILLPKILIVLFNFFFLFLMNQSPLLSPFHGSIDRTEVSDKSRWTIQKWRIERENLRSSTAPLCVRSSTRSLNAGSTIRTKIPKFLQESVWNPPPIRSRIPPRCTFPCNFWSRIGSPGPTTVFYWCEINEFRHLELY